MRSDGWGGGWWGGWGGGFFFSSRRRHTRFTSDWSSDVCSSDLPAWREELGSNVNVDVDSYWRGTLPEDTKKFMKATQPTSHAGEFETSIFMAAFPERLRFFTMQQYDHAHVDHENVPSPEIAEFLRRDGRTFKNGKIDLAGEKIGRASCRERV